MFITIEGPDGVGKTTVVNLLIKVLKDFKYVHFPRYNTNLGQIIYKILNKEYDFLEQYLQLFCSLDRILFSQDSDIRNSNIIADRYFISGIVYTLLSNQDLKTLLLLEKDIVKPDLTVILYSDVDTILSRLNERSTQKTIFESRDKIEKVLNLYMNISNYIQDYNIVYINANNTPQEIVKRILQEMIRRDLI